LPTGNMPMKDPKENKIETFYLTAKWIEIKFI
jgi:hypothetical protein